MRILVCGSRGWSDQHIIGVVLGGFLRAVETDCDDKMTIIQGLAPGADHLARHFYGGKCSRCGHTYGLHDLVEHEDYPADWKRYGKAAGFLRNRQMLEEGRPDMVVAFRVQGKSPGTDMMVNIATAAGLRVYVVGRP